MDTLREAKKLMDNDISKVQVNYIDFNGNNKTGIIEVHKLVADEVKEIFDEIKESGFQIEKIEPIEKYNYSDKDSVIANNSSAYNFRFVGETSKLSDHAIGLAIDINPFQNPWVHPSALNLTKYNESLKGTILSGSKIVEIFNDHGWTWGGIWKNPDYQHFFKGGELNKSIKNKLYDELGIDNPYLKKEQSTPVKGNRVGKFKDFMKNTYNKIIGESVKDLLVGPTKENAYNFIKEKITNDEELSIPNINTCVENNWYDLIDKYILNHIDDNFVPIDFIYSCIKNDNIGILRKILENDEYNIDSFFLKSDVWDDELIDSCTNEMLKLIENYLKNI